MLLPSIKKVAIILLLLTALAFGFQAHKDTDFGWHYRCGKELLSGKPCLNNNYSYFLPDYKSYNPSFVYDAVLAVVYDNFNFIGLSYANSIILLLCVICLYKLIQGPFWIKIILPLLILFVPGPSLVNGLRSQVFTFLFFLLTILISQKALTNYKYLYLLPLLFILWVNTHIGFIAGILLLPGIFLTYYPYKLKQVILPLLLAFLFTFINPFGPKVYLEILHHFQAPLSTTIAEWVAPSFLIQIIVLLFSFELIFFLHTKKLLNLPLIANLLIFTVLAFTGIRNLIFFAVFLIIYLSQSLPNKKLLNYRLSILIIISCLFFFSNNINKAYNFDTKWQSYCNNGQIPLPCKFIEKYPNLSGNVYATYEWGGFLIWKLPNIKVFADGRTPSWLDENGKSTYEVYLSTLQTQKGWNEKLSETKTDYILISPGTFLDLLLKQDAKKYNWKEEYRDNVAVLYSRI